MPLWCNLRSGDIADLVIAYRVAPALAAGNVEESEFIAFLEDGSGGVLVGQARMEWQLRQRHICRWRRIMRGEIMLCFGNVGKVRTNGPKLRVERARGTLETKPDPPRYGFGRQIIHARS